MKPGRDRLLVMLASIFLTLILVVSCGQVSPKPAPQPPSAQPPTTTSESKVTKPTNAPSGSLSEGAFKSNKSRFISFSCPTSGSFTMATIEFKNKKVTGETAIAFEGYSVLGTVADGKVEIRPKH